MQATSNIKTGAEEMKQKACEFLEWTELEFAEFQFKCGTQYLQHYIPNDPEGIDALVKERIFWNWWRNQWTMRDNVFLFDCSAEYSLRLRRTLYEALHNPSMLAKEIYPNSIVLGKAYAVMIGELIDNQNA